MNQRARAELALAGVTLLWGTTFVVIKDALTSISPVLLITLRFAVAGLFLALFYRKALRKQGLKVGLFAGVLLFSAYVFQTKGLELTTPPKSAFLTGLSIPMVPLLSSLVYKSRPRLIEVLGIAVASLGMILMTLPSGKLEISRGDFLSFLCAVVFAMHIVVLAHFTPIVGFETIAVVQVLTTAALGALLFPFVEPIRLIPSFSLGAVIVVMGLLATALAFTTMAWAQQYTSATRAALIFALEPVIAWLTSYFLTGEVLTPRAQLGAGLILAGILLCELKLSELKRNKAPRHLIEGGQRNPAAAAPSQRDFRS